MADLKCGATDCMYNEDRLCSKGDICVGGKSAKCSDETCCESYSPRKDRDSYKNSTHHATHNISIDCEAAQCAYNKDLRCKADHVDIMGCADQKGCNTACKTFKEC